MSKKKTGNPRKRRFLTIDKKRFRRNAKVVYSFSREKISNFNSFAMGEREFKPTNKTLFGRIFLFIQRHFLLPFTRFTNRLTHPFLTYLVAVFLILLLGVAWLTNSTISVDYQTVSVAGLANDLNGYKILLISDLHGRSFGTKQATLLRAINNESYNLVLFCGDMIGKRGKTQPFFDLLDGMTAKRETYFISGDSDPAPILSAAREDMDATLSDLVLSDWVLGAQQRGAHFLSCTTQVEVGSSSLWLTPSDMLCLRLKDAAAEIEAELSDQTEGAVYGIDADYDGQPLTQYRFNQINKEIDAAKAMSSDLHIALSHIPPTDEYLSSVQTISYENEITISMPDIVLSGHYCGGGWQLPFVGAFYVPDEMLPNHGWFPSSEWVSGLRKCDTLSVVTTGGLSVTDRIYLPKFRLFNEPSITIITLTAELDSGLK